MMKINLLLFFIFLGNIAFAQEEMDVQKTIEEGIAYYDKGDYSGALVRYDKVLEADSTNMTAIAEKAMTLLALNKNEEAILLCKKAIETQPGNDALRSIFITYGTALDNLKETDKSIEIYEQGIRQFPGFYSLHFNKGITLASVKRTDEAIYCFQQSAIIKPKHAGSHNALARMENIKDNRIPALLAYCRFFVIEPQGNRAQENLGVMKKLLKGDVQQNSDKSIQININSNALLDTTEHGKENNFSSTDFLLLMVAALDYDKKHKKESDVEQFIRKFDTVCSSLKENMANNSGFYWEYYVPYFVEMKAKNYVETFSYIAFASSDDKKVDKWIKGHKTEIDNFYKWSNDFKWKTY